ncbi:sporulation protein [Streptomyces sp. NPDC050803]|uniref:sporulation protein n=1 Tax=unclassified Streptomyces TaxID=2593676 RepID=UPI003447F26B
MAFRTFLSSLGINAPQVETVLDRGSVRPGEQLTATVTLRGGGADVLVERLKLDVVGLFEDNESNESSWDNPGVLLSWTDEQPFTLAAGKDLVKDVVFQLPFEMPLTHFLGGKLLKGARVAVRTELAIDKSVDRGDFDEFHVHPLAPQDIVLQAFADLGFRFDEAELKRGTPSSAVASRVDWWQEIEMWFPAEYGSSIGQVEIAFNAFEDSMDLLTGGTGRLSFSYDGLDAEKVRAELDAHYRSRFLPGS